MALVFVRVGLGERNSFGSNGAGVDVGVGVGVIAGTGSSILFIMDGGF